MFGKLPGILLLIKLYSFEQSAQSQFQNSIPVRDGVFKVTADPDRPAIRSCTNLLPLLFSKKPVKDIPPPRRYVGGDKRLGQTGGKGGKTIAIGNF